MYSISKIFFGKLLLFSNAHLLKSQEAFIVFAGEPSAQDPRTENRERRTEARDARPENGDPRTEKRERRLSTLAEDVIGRFSAQRDKLVLIYHTNIPY